MVDIPRQMSNEESRKVAAVVVAERQAAIANAVLTAAQNHLNKYYMHR